MKPKILIARAVFDDVIQKLQQHFEVTANQDDIVMTSTQLSAKLSGHIGLIATGSEHINAELLKAHPQLRAVANMMVGYNNFDLAAMHQANVIGTNTPDVLTETTADFGWALLMATARRVTESEHFLRSGSWDRWSLTQGFLGQDVYGSTLGIIGMGRIGQAIARRAKGFGMRVVYHNRQPLQASVQQDLDAQYLSKSELLKTADHVVLVLPYSAASHHTIGKPELDMMKPSATLVNLARGGIVDDAALALALQQKRIFAAGLDVFEHEPAVHPELLKCINIVLTPHIASASDKTRRAMAHLAADNLIAALGLGVHAGRPMNRVD